MKKIEKLCTSGNNVLYRLLYDICLILENSLSIRDDSDDF
jgi:hypothetical protein